MSAVEVRASRERLGLTQQQAARRWKVSQAYLSLMEHGKRPVPDRLARLVARAEPQMATALSPDASPGKSDDLPRLVGSLGYPGFAYLAEARAVMNPAAVVLAALRTPVVPARVTEALPWVLVTFAHLDWGWLVDQAKLANLQNRLGYLVTLARTVAERQGNAGAAQALTDAEHRLEEARLAKEDTLGREVTEAERRYLREHRPPAAAHWNLLTNLRAEDLRYAR